MLSDIKLCFCLIILQLVILKFRFFPLDCQYIIFKIRIIASFLSWDIFHQITQLFSDFFKFIHSGLFNIIRSKNLLDQICLCLDLRNISHTCYSFYFLSQISSCFYILFSHQICKLYPIHQCIKSDCICLILFRLNQWRNFLFYSHGISISKSLIIRLIRIHFNVFQVLPYCKIISW